VMEIINDKFMACEDCTPVLTNGDFSHIDYHYQYPEEREWRVEEIDEGIENAGGYIALGDREYDEEFSRDRCDCCGGQLAGRRTHFVVMA